jgi:YesN/AraC family two-component response regulator
LMPGGINGLQLAGLARAECPDLHIVLTSGWADSELPKTLAGSALPFVLKPYSLEELRATLDPLDRSNTGH